MIKKPQQFSAQNAAAFHDQSVVDAYRYRPPYPDEVFTILATLITTAPRRVLDVGCGTGELARLLAPQVEQVDAVDFSQAMIAQGRRLPNGDHPHLRWLQGRIEEISLAPPYSLATAGASLHWLDWNVVFPRFQAVLQPGGYVAIVDYVATPDPWTLLQPILNRYRTDGTHHPYDMLAELAAHKLFYKVGEQQTAPYSFTQSLDDYIESYHSRSGFSRERMGQERANAFDQEIGQTLKTVYPAGQMALSVVGRVIWGIPGAG